MLPKYAVENRTVVGFCVALTLLGGVWSYFSMGRLEDPEFTIKTAVVATLYPGATATEVDTRITEVVQRHIRRVKGVKNTRAISKPGMSIIFVDMLDDYPPHILKTAWQDLRNKMDGLRTELPIEATSPQVRDDFGDVYGIILALSGDGFSDAELRDRAKDLQRQLQTVDQVGRVELWGIRQENVEISISRSQMAKLAVHPAMVMLALAQQNLQTDAGQMTVGDDNIKINPVGRFESIEEIGDLIIPNGLSAILGEGIASAATGVNNSSLATMLLPPSSGAGEPIRLRDIATTIQRTCVDPPNEIMRSNGKPSVAIAISPISGGDVIKMGKLVQKRADEVLAGFPVGYKIDRVCYQPDNVVVAVEAFEGNLREAIIIVTVVVMIAMGLRSGLLITGSLLVVIFGTLCVLYPLGVVLQRTSLGAFIVALGILVDDAVVVGDMILVNMQRGMNRKDACIEGARHVGHQLLGATIVGALAFLPVYLSPDPTGEYCRDLFIVVAVSLGISWFVAMMQTPVVYYQFVHIKPLEEGEETKDPHSGPVFQAYRRLLIWVLHHKTVAIFLLVCVLVASGYGFTHVGQIFFPPAQRTQFMLEYWRPEGTAINSVSTDMMEMEKYIAAQKNVTNIATFVGSGPPRFYLPYEPEIPNQCYGMMLVNVKSIKDVDTLISPVEKHLKEQYSKGLVRLRRFALGPSTQCDIEIRFRGPDHTVLRELAEQAKKILHTNQKAKDITDDWRENRLVWSPTYSQTKGVRTMISRSDMNFALRWATLGIPVSVFNDGDNLIPITLRGTPEERNDMTNIENIPVWGGASYSVPLAHVISGGKLAWEPSQIRRRNGIATITVGCNPTDDTTWNQLFAAIKPDIAKIEIPHGYEIAWGGQEEKSIGAEKTLLGFLPITMVLMSVIVVALFNSLKQPLIILCTFPLLLIGITVGLIITGLPFGFMALVGAMSLLGMSVRNGVVLMSQIDVEMAKGESPYEAIVNASVERMRPVTVAAMTVVVGMIPLLRDPLFNSMAAAIMFGLIFATLLTLLIVPALYMIFFRVSCRAEDGDFISLCRSNRCCRKRRLCRSQTV